MALVNGEELFTSAYACQLLYCFQDIRELVQEHDEKVATSVKESQSNSVDKKYLVNFKSTHLIGFWTDDEKRHGYDHLESTYLTYPITLRMILEFIQLNRHLIKCDKEGYLSINYEKNEDKISSEDDDDGKLQQQQLLQQNGDSSHYPRLPIEDIISNMIEDDITFYELDDRFYNSELIYCIIMNKSKKIIKIVFRASKTNTDWITNLSFNKITTKFIKSFASSKKTRIHSGFVGYLLDSKATVDRDTSKFDEIVSVVKEIRSKKDDKGNELYKDYNLIITGHSLGGALAQLLGFALAGSNPIEDLPGPICVVTFGTPGIGNVAFVKSFKLLEQRNTVRHIRISVDGDFFPTVPYIFTPQCGVNINLLKNQKAKIKYANEYNFIARTCKAFFNILFKQNKTIEKHLVDKHIEYLKLDVNKYITGGSIEGIYKLSGALSRFQRHSFMTSILMTKEQRLRGTLLVCCCNPRSVNLST